MTLQLLIKNEEIMTKCNENMTPGSSSKGGYLRVERNVLKASFGDNVEILEPANVREQMKEKLISMLQKYET